MVDTRIKLIAETAAEEAIDLQLLAGQLCNLAARLKNTLGQSELMDELGRLAVLVQAEADDSSRVARAFDHAALGEAVCRQIETRGVLAVLEGGLTQELALWLASSRDANLHYIDDPKYAHLRAKRSRRVDSSDGAA